MSSSKEQIREYIVATVNAHLKEHKQAPLTPKADNWTKVIDGCKSADVAKRIAAEYGVSVPAKLSDLASLDAAVDYAFDNQK
ncbi:MAG TPA: hypothetical protein VM621_18260 [Luteibacter sp.]|uniref:hypothetical protein n=1 Tax=Luteibacter sp. TaxID=1886636 RepID=UPI002C5D80C6|nr:hypothetical protein [Luteibacter sp.]HVI56990.1 hypothetical protein [Luteibacter sp.]